MTKVRILFSLILCTLLFCCCSQEKKLRIGVSQCSADDWRNKMNQEILREAMLHDNIEVEIRSADDDNNRQIEDLRYFADNKFDIIIAAPNEAQALTPIIKEIYESGTPVILFDREINGDSYTAFQGADNMEIGRLAGKMAENLRPEGAEILEIRGRRGSSPEVGRHEGFNKATEHAGMRVNASAYGDWTAERSAVVADSLLRLYPQTNIIYAHNDRMAIAAAQVAERLGRPDIKIIGIDAAPNIGIRAVKDSVIDATFLYPTNGGQLIRTAMAILEGKPFEKHLILPSPSAVDLTNAELLLLQDDNLREETEKIKTLKGQLDVYWQQHSMQTAILYGALVILLLLVVVIFLLVRNYWTARHHRQQIEQHNAELSAQKEELDRLYKRLQEATSAKLNFFTNVSHDLRTPLTLIADPVTQLSAAENLTPQQHTLMQLADKNVKRLARLVDQILDIRKYDSSHLKLKLTQVDLSQLLREWSSSFHTLAIKRHITLETLVGEGADYTTAIDVEKMERVLFNLLSNSFKFTPTAGRITISLSRKEEQIILQVSDTGCGIAAQDVAKVFDPFFKTEKINPNGSGIGLVLSKIFVEMHGGAISVESTEGEGTTFTVTLPVVRDNAEVVVENPMQTAVNRTKELEPVEASLPEVDEDTPKVLIIDDNEDIRTLIATTLGSEYTILQAASGAQGIRLASKYIPDLIISDVMMPGMDGYETCRALKSEVITSHIPVLLLTACSRDEQRTEAYNCGADAYMSKPFDTQMLQARCRSLIENRRLVLTSREPGVPSISLNKELPKTPQSAGAPVDASALDNDFYRRFAEIVHQELSNSELTVEDVASRLMLSRVQMYRKIKGITGYTPTELIRNLRLEQAAIQLKTTETSISEIAYSVGFTSPGHFTKCYKGYFGELPTATQQRTSKKQ